MRVWVLSEETVQDKQRRVPSQPMLLRIERLVADHSFLRAPVLTGQRWGNDGVPVERQGRFVTTSPAELNQCLGRESGNREEGQKPQSEGWSWPLFLF